MVDVHSPDKFTPAPEDDEKLEDWVRNYLSPSVGESGHRAHKFICNILTYPLVRDLHFAATPHAPHVTKSSGKISVKNRSLSLIAGLESTRPGDLIFFHQSEAHAGDESLEEYHGYDRDSQAKRGVVGIYRILSQPFTDSTDITHPDTGYTISGSCSDCGTNFSWMKGLTDQQVSKIKSKSGSGNIPKTGTINQHWCPGTVLENISQNHSNQDNHGGSLTLSNRLLLEPIAVFPDSIGDNRLYMDFSDEAIFWTGRTDSKMGAGKGSTTRQILPEEAAMLTRWLRDEARGDVDYPARRNYSTPSDQLEPLSDHNDAHHDGMYMVGDSGKLAKELYLNIYFAQNAERKSAFQREIPDVYNIEDVEHFSTEYPIGAAGDEVDFVVSFKDDQKDRYRINLFEFKKGKINNRCLGEMMLYIPWITQSFSQFPKPEITEVEVVPILVGYGKTERGKYALRRTEQYSFTETYVSGNKVETTVTPSRVLLYDTKNIATKNGDKYAQNLEFEEVSGDCEKVNWPHLKGLCKSDLDWVMDEIWNPADVDSN